MVPVGAHSRRDSNKPGRAALEEAGIIRCTYDSAAEGWLNYRQRLICRSGCLWENSLHEASGLHVILYRGRDWDVCQKLLLYCTSAVAFSPDGRRMAVAAYSIIRLLDMTEGGNVYAELLPGRKIKRIAFSSDSSELITDHGLLAVPGDVGGSMHWRVWFA